MKHFEIRLHKPRGEYATVFSISCLHIGHKGYDAKHAEGYRDYILKTPDTYVFDLGDDIENALPGDERHNSMLWDSNLTPEEQYARACDYWLPLAEAGKVLVTHDSNHWWRTEAKTGISIARQMNVFLRHNAPAKSAPEFGRWQALSRLRLGKQTYVIHSTHGSGGGTTPEAALRKCREAAASHHADVYLRGHHHKRIVYEDVYFDWRAGDHKPVERKRIFGVTGCFLRWDDSYAERAGYPPSIRGAIKLSFSAKKHDIRIGL